MYSACAAIAISLLLAGEATVPVAPAAPSATAVAAIEFPGIRIFPGERRIEADAAFVIVDDAYWLEYVAVGPQGKTHESLLELRCAPEKLQFGLIVLGLEPRPEVRDQGEALELKGPRVEIEVEWMHGKERRRARVEDLLQDAPLGAPMERVGFAFTGSRFIRGFGGGAAGDRPVEIFAAGQTGSAIALYHDPDAILDNPLVTGGDIPLLVPTFRMPEIVGWVPGDERLKPATAKLPPRGTEAKLHLRPAVAPGGPPLPKADATAGPALPGKADATGRDK